MKEVGGAAQEVEEEMEVEEGEEEEAMQREVAMEDLVSESKRSSLSNSILVFSKLVSSHPRT